jgi:hypothetical protein
MPLHHGLGVTTYESEGPLRWLPRKSRPLYVLIRTCESLGCEALVLPSRAVVSSEAFKRQVRQRPAAGGAAVSCGPRRGGPRREGR